eukprot:TRINITY_DN4660_c0_g1_i1.p1 TRINITY_DN4660_c0_g1~~TRINITY_DN4660_c0_g1_i1.p1  ORF type:complete len:371 (+),score=140.07 TRINITY_DN4660_c0_g1_i1:27-1115(+)
MTFETVLLYNGVAMPTIALGTWKSPPGLTGDAVKAAVRAGYRAIDCANDYGNEAEVGAALADLFTSGEVKREDLFIQCKLWNSNHRKEHVRPDLLASLEDLRLTYVDSYVIHWPQACPSTGLAPAVCKDGPHPGPKASGCMFPLEADGTYSSDNGCHFVETWEAMEALVDEGLCRTIGLSNFNQQQILDVLEHAKKHRPAILQNEAHPYLQQKDLVDFCRWHSIVFQAYSPLGSFDRPWAKAGSITSGPPVTGQELLQDPTVTAIAARHHKTAAQIVLRWHIQRGCAAAPKSVRPERIQENLAVLDFTLTPADEEALGRLNCGWRHLMWAETAMHPDYPFKDSLPHGYVPGPAPTSTTSSGQ